MMTRMPATTFLTGADVQAVFDWRSAVDALRAAYSVPADASRFRRVPWRAGTVHGCGQAVAGRGNRLGIRGAASRARASRGAWLEPGMTVVSIGSTLPNNASWTPRRSDARS